MAPDKSWMNIRDRRENAYQSGVESFIDFAVANGADMSKIFCPCTKCRNTKYLDKEEVHYHLLRHGIVNSYTTWYRHGETFMECETQEIYEHSSMPPVDDLIGLIHDVSGIGENQRSADDGGNSAQGEEEPQGESAKFYRFLQDAKQKLYPGCEHSNLGAIVKLLHLKSFHRWTNTSFNALLELLQELIPGGKETLPGSFYGAQRYMSELGLDYIKFDVCLNNCVVYWDVNANAQCCPVCGLSRWKVVKRLDGGTNEPHKVLRYFPIKHRLQRLFMSAKTSSEMRWHKEKRVEDGVMRHPADTMQWKSFDSEYFEFALDARNVRLGLASDGFQPFGNMSSQHSIWPVLLMPYNLPPWMCMKQPYLIMSLLIPGPHSPGMGIDVFLQPLIKDLKELWEDGVQTYDAHARQNFTMRAALLWTINDFPAYGDLSGWCTKGYLACPSCHKETASMHLQGARKLCYVGHRRLLPMSHKWRKASMAFDGTVENRSKPMPLSGVDVLREVQSFQQAPFGRGVKRKYDSSNSYKNWRKRSVFFELPYWKTLLIRHNLDVMHIEKNVCDNVIGTIMNIKGKTKDTIGSRYDLVNLGIRPELHPKKIGDVVHISAAQYTLSNDEKVALCDMLKKLKTPDGFVSNISRCVNVNDRKISGMKSHDSHVFIQRLLPMAIRSFLHKDVCEPLVELSSFFRDLCRKSLDSAALLRLNNNIILTLCKLEMIFPPSFFDVMIHLVVHLAEEARIAGPVQYRWMYPIERYLRTLKSYVRNKARPEGSIAEAYIVDECLTFCSRYIEGVDTKFNRPPRYSDIHEPDNMQSEMSIFVPMGTPLGAVKFEHISYDIQSRAHLYVLNNCPEVAPYVEQYRSTMPNLSRAQFQTKYKSEFPEWFMNCVVALHKQGTVSEELFCLAVGPTLTCKKYHGYDVNGFRFRTSARDQSRRTQCSGVLCRGDNNSTEKEYYGKLDEIWVMQYSHSNVVPLFKCQWYDVRNSTLGYRVDNYGITSVKLNRRLQTDEEFILASQAEQVFYVEDPKDPSWAVVMKTQPRDLYSIPRPPPENNEDLVEPDIDEAYQEEEDDAYGRVMTPLDEGDDIQLLHRDDIEPETNPTAVTREIEERVAREALLVNDFIDENGEANIGNEYVSDESDWESSSSDD